jgi:hypothetical protein
MNMARSSTTTEEWSFDALINHCIISQPAAFLRRRVIEKFGRLDKAHKYCVDYEYWIRLAKQGVRFLFAPQFFAATRLHASAKTIAARLECHVDVNDIMVEHFGQVPARWIANYAHIKAENMIDPVQNKFAFIPMLVMHCLAADLRWNKRISPSTVRMVSGWMFGRLRSVSPW